MIPEYTPTTEEVRQSYRAGAWLYAKRPPEPFDPSSLHETYLPEFDRWLSELIRKEREEAWGEGRRSTDSEYEHIFNGHPVPEGEMCDECNEWGKNPYTKEQP